MALKCSRSPFIIAVEYTYFYLTVQLLTKIQKKKKKRDNQRNPVVEK